MELLKKAMQAIGTKSQSLAVSALVGLFSLFGFSLSAQAALSTAITDALETAKTDGVTMGGLVLAVIVAIIAFRYLRKAL